MIHLCNKLPDAFSGFMDVLIGVEVNLFFLEGSDQPFGVSVFPRTPSPLAIGYSFQVDCYCSTILREWSKFPMAVHEPILQTMYVDKRLDGLQCVQSLSRLNRVAPGKTDTLVLDFVNEPDQVQEAFQQYYQTTTLRGYDLPGLLREHDETTAEIVKAEIDGILTAEFCKNLLAPVNAAYADEKSTILGEVG